VRFFILLLAGLSVQAQRIVDPPELTGKPTKPRKEPSEVMTAFVTEISKGGNKTAELMPMVSTFIQAHPTFGDAYGFRVLGQYCELKQPASETFIDDVNKAIQYFTPEGLTGKNAELYGIRARLQYDLGRFQTAVDDLEKGIKLSPDDADDVLLVGAVKPGTRAEEENLCAWTKTELDSLSRRFPSDYRVSLYRGLCLSKLSFFRTEGGDALVATIRRSKTAAGHRTLPLNGDAMAALSRLMERARALGSSEPQHYVFPTCEHITIDPTDLRKAGGPRGASWLRKPRGRWVEKRPKNH